MLPTVIVYIVLETVAVRMEEWSNKGDRQRVYETSIKE